MSLPLSKQISPEQLKEILVALCEKSKNIFISEKTYEVKIIELENKISELEAEVDILSAYKAKIDEIIEVIDVNPENIEEFEFNNEEGQ